MHAPASQVDSENTVVALLNLWYASQPPGSVGEDQARVLARGVRVRQLTSGYRQEVLPQLPWFKVRRRSQ